MESLEFEMGDFWSSRRVLLLAVATDFFIRTVDVFSSVFDLLLAVVLSTLSIGIEYGAIELSQWIGYLILAFVFAPHVYPITVDRLGSSEILGLRVFFASGTLVTAIALNGLTMTGMEIAVYVTGSVLLGVPFLLFIVLTGHTVLSSESIPAAELIHFSSHFEEEIRTDLSYTGILGIVSRGLLLIAFSLLYAIPCWIAGIATNLLANMFPVTDLLVLGYLLLLPVSRRMSVIPQPSAELLEIEETGYRLGNEATTGLKSFVLLFFVVLGGAGGGFVFAMAFVATNQHWRELWAIDDSLMLWSVFGGLLLVFASALHLVWFWYRMISRTLAFLERWRGSPVRTAPASKPLLGVLPGTVVLLTAMIGFQIMDGRTGRSIFAVLWPLLVLALLTIVYEARRRHPDPLRPTGRTVTLNLALFFFGLLLSRHLPELMTFHAGRIGLLSFIRSSNLAVPLFLPLVAVLPDVIRYSNQQDGPRRYAAQAYLAFFAMAIAGLAVLSSGAVQNGLFVMAGFAGISAPVLFITTYFER